MKKRLGFDLILLGDSAAGKDTQAELLVRKYNVRLVRSGEYFRKLLKDKKYRKALLATYKQGKPSPTELLIKLLNHSLKNLRWHQNLIFVGAARLKPEAEYLVKQLKHRHRDFFVIYLRLPVSEVVRRSRSRLREPEDRNPKFLKNRFAYYKNQVSQTVAFYRRLKKLKFVDANHTIKQVHQAIEKTICDYQQCKRN